MNKQKKPLMKRVSTYIGLAVLLISVCYSVSLIVSTANRNAAREADRIARSEAAEISKEEAALKAEQEAEEQARQEAEYQAYLDSLTDEELSALEAEELEREYEAANPFTYDDELARPLNVTDENIKDAVKSYMDDKGYDVTGWTLAIIDGDGYGNFILRYGSAKESEDIYYIVGYQLGSKANTNSISVIYVRDTSDESSAMIRIKTQYDWNVPRF